MIRASGHAAMVVLAGLFLLAGGASQAAPAATNTTKADSTSSKSAESDKSTKHRRAANHRSGKTSDDKADNKKDAVAATANNNAPASDGIPPAVANANAQLASADTPTAAAASAMTNRANDNVQQAAGDNAAPSADGQAAESNPVNDPERALQQNNPPSQTPAIAATDAQPQRPAPVMASSSSDGSAWEQSSLIGKIFIGFGALLTLASAARMFMA